MPIAGGYKYIVVAGDDLSLAAEGRPLRACNATVLAAFFGEQIFCRYGAVIQVVTDNGPEIEGAFRELLTQYHIPQTRISPYNNQAKLSGRKVSFYYAGDLDEILQTNWKLGLDMSHLPSLPTKYPLAQWPNAVHFICSMAFTWFYFSILPRQLSRLKDIHKEFLPPNYSLCEFANFKNVQRIYKKQLKLDRSSVPIQGSIQEKIYAEN